jgi:DNA-binding MarR family transcriptional regulator
MGEALKRRIKQETSFANPAQEAMLNLMVAADHFRAQLDRVCAQFGITHGQYNVLRILRGVHPEGHPRCEIAARMLEKAPDVTRLVDRLEAQGLVERTRSEADRRLSLLEEVQPAMEGVERYFAERVSRRDARELSRICEGLYGDED